MRSNDPNAHKLCGTIVIKKKKKKKGQVIKLYICTVQHLCKKIIQNMQTGISVLTFHQTLRSPRSSKATTRSTLSTSPRAFAQKSDPTSELSGISAQCKWFRDRSSQKVRHGKSRDRVHTASCSCSRSEAHWSGAESPLLLYTAWSQVHSAGAHKADGRNRFTKEPIPFERLV